MIMQESGLVVNGFSDVAMRYLSDQGSTILEFKRRAQKNLKAYGSPYTLKAITEQMKLCFQNFPGIPEMRPSPPRSIVSLAFPHPERYGVRVAQESVPNRCKYFSFFFLLA